ncbi:putative papain-like cysteine peptidase superfamily [Helianthus annuus]|nr:putative papain-like cysteine peptidase superfamily [Helianthus annuus]
MDPPPSTEMKSTVLYPNQKGFHYSLRESYEDVWLQNLESCVANSMTHMLTILHRKASGNNNLRLSPNAILRIMTPNGIDVVDAANIAKSGGLEEHEEGQPIYEKVENFQYKDSTRYRLKDFKFVSGHYNVVCKLAENFGPGGRCYPLIGYCHPMGSFAQTLVASETSMQNPYRWGAFNSPDDARLRKLQNESDIVSAKVLDHAMLITGLYTMADNPKVKDFSVEVKNYSLGPKWATSAYAWVTPDVFNFIGVPEMEDDNMIFD